MDVRPTTSMAIAVIVAVALAGGCDDDFQPVDHPEGQQAWELAHDAQVADDEIVATVDGHPITTRDVEAAWRDMPEATVSEVVDEVIEREMMAREALRQGYGDRPEVAFARKQGLVSALLLEEVEKNAEPDESRRASFTEHIEATRSVPPGLRASHLVILVPEEADGQTREQLYGQARRHIDEVRQALDSDADDDALREMADELNDGVLDGDLQAVVNEHMRFPRADERVVPEHLPEGWVTVVDDFARGAEAVAGDDERGTLSEPVRSEFGWHLIRVDEAIEARPVESDALEAFVDYELRRGAREARLRGFVEDWAAGVPAEVYPDRLESGLDE